MMQNSKMTCETVMRFILDKELTDSVAIVLHPDTFDFLAMDYISQNGSIERPFELLGIEIIEDSSGKTARNSIGIIEQ